MRCEFFLLFCALVSAAPSAHPAHAGHHVHHKRQHISARGDIKKGLLYAPGPGLSAFSGKVGWSANWATAPSAGGANLGEFCSQYWGVDDNHKGNFEKDSGNYNGAHLIGYNEPDRPDQASIDTQTAVNNWGIMDTYQKTKNAKIGSPSCSNSALPNQGIQWQRDFLTKAKAQGYAIDFLTWHWYGGDANTVAQDQAMFTQQAHEYRDLATEHGIKEIWITEMQRKNKDGEAEFIQWFISEFIPQNDYITRYAYNEQIGSLTNGAGLTPAGQAYLA